MAKKETFQTGEVSFLSSDVVLEGNLRSNGSLRIDGEINGNVEVKENLTIGETAKIKGDVKAQNITLNGTVEGAISAENKVVLESSSKLVGDIFCKVLKISEGAIFEGKSSMKSKINQELTEQ